MKTIVIYHSADYDGIFCREIAKKFLGPGSEQEPNEYIGWNFGDPPVKPTAGFGRVYVLDLPCDKPLGLEVSRLWPGCSNLIWIDHHKSSIASHPASLPGYRIDGVAACRLAWQWFTMRAEATDALSLPTKDKYLNRIVDEPLAVRLAGEYDVWDHRGDGDLEFQFGLDSVALTPAGWTALLSEYAGEYAKELVQRGSAAMACYAKRDADIMHSRSFLLNWEGLKFLALNTARCNSNTFAARDVPETGHDALMGFYFNGKVWVVSLYHAKHRTDLDLSEIAVRYNGGGHRGACGFTIGHCAFAYGVATV